MSGEASARLVDEREEEAGELADATEDDNVSEGEGGVTLSV